MSGRDIHTVMHYLNVGLVLLERLNAFNTELDKAEIHKMSGMFRRRLLETRKKLADLRRLYDMEYAPEEEDE